jgi:hypothetical protein
MNDGQELIRRRHLPTIDVEISFSSNLKGTICKSIDNVSCEKKSEVLTSVGE